MIFLSHSRLQIGGGIQYVNGAVGGNSITQSVCNRPVYKGMGSICLATQLPIHLSNDPSIHPSVCPSTHPSMDLSANPSVVPSAFPFICPVCLYHISVHGSLLVTYSCICLAIITYPSICPRIHPSHPSNCLPICLLGHW